MIQNCLHLCWISVYCIHFCAFTSLLQRKKTPRSRPPERRKSIWRSLCQTSRGSKPPSDWLSSCPFLADLDQCCSSHGCRNFRTPLLSEGQVVFTCSGLIWHRSWHRKNAIYCSTVCLSSEVWGSNWRCLGLWLQQCMCFKRFFYIRHHIRYCNIRISSNGQTSLKPKSLAFQINCYLDPLVS